jgi:DnaJ-domain-containing protein 1
VREIVAIRGASNEQEQQPVPSFDAPAVTPAGERVSAWADRLRDKRRRDQERIRAAETAGSDEPAAGPAHWSAESVLGRDDAHGAGFDLLAPVSSRRIECLGVLGLDPAAGDDDIALAYRNLAKQHHPDRWAEADQATQATHAEAMLRINAAYRALRDVPLG